MTLEQYIDNINQRYKLGNSTEHTFRSDLQQLIESIVPDVIATYTDKKIPAIFITGIFHTVVLIR